MTGRLRSLSLIEHDLHADLDRLKPDLRTAVLNLVSSLSDDNLRKTIRLANARIDNLNEPQMYLEGDTFQVLFPRFMVADLLRALSKET